MQNSREIARSIAAPLVERLVRLQEPDGSFRDPVFGFRDPRPAAEAARALLVLGREGPALRALRWLLSTQNKNGSWNEVLPDLDEESCVATATVGRLLLQASRLQKSLPYREAALRAGDYILSREFSPGYFIKSFRHYADVLNVNATCGAFLFELFRETEQRKYIEARDRAIFNTVRYQFKDGAFPYASSVESFPDPWHEHVRSSHYQAITLYFLLHSDPYLENPYLRIAAPRAVAWLESVFRSRGIDWSRERLLFSVGVTAVYAYAAWCFQRMGREGAALRALKKVGELQTDGGFLRYEPPRASETLRGLLREFFELEYSNPPGYPWTIRVRRVLQRAQREFVERPRAKFSFYYSTQILDCMTELMSQEKES